MRTGGVEPPQPWAAGLQPAELSRCSASAWRGDRPDSNRRCRAHNPECYRYTTASTTRTTGLEPATFRSTGGRSGRLSYVLVVERSAAATDLAGAARNVLGDTSLVESSWSRRSRGLTSRGSSAGGIRTHGLELMRLAGTAAPLPRKSGRLESNQRSPAPEAGGMAIFPYDQSHTLGGARTRSFRVESPASSPLRPRGRSSGGRDRTCASRLTAARLAARPRRNERKERESNPQGLSAHPFRDGVPRRWQSFLGGPGRSRTCAASVKSQQRCLELRSRRVGGEGSNLRRLAFQASALPGRTTAPRQGRQGWTRTSSLLFVRQGALPLSYSPTRFSPFGESSSPRAKTFGCAGAFALGFQVPGQGVEPRLSRFRAWRPAG